MTQSDKVLAYMKEQGSITTMEAFSRLNITRLSARVWDLRHRGIEIINRRVYTKNGTHYDVYSLAEEP